MSLLLENIHQLHPVATHGELRKAGKAMADTAMVENAFLYIEDGKIHSIGKMGDMNPAFQEAEEIIDCEERLVLPGFVDSHTHLVFAKSREGEYVDRIK